MSNRYRDKKDRIEFCITSVLTTHQDDGTISRRHIDRVYVNDLSDLEELEDMEEYLLAQLHLKFLDLP